MLDIGFLELFILGLASFRLTRLLVFDQIMSFMRNLFINEIEEVDENGKKVTYLVPKSGKFKGFIEELLNCYWCTGVWSSIVLCVLYMTIPSLSIPVILILAVAGLGAIIETFIQIWSTVKQHLQK